GQPKHPRRQLPSEAGEARFYRGCVGLLRDGRIKGWIANPAALDERIKIQIRVGGYLSQPMVANKPHDSVATKSLGDDGAFGFSLKLPPNVPLRETDSIDIVLAGNQTPVLSV